MSLSHEPVFSLLKSDFVCGWHDIEKEPYCGISGKHSVNNPAVDTSNGAGPHNIQMFVMTPDGIVLHCLPGYWNPNDLAYELKFAEELNKVWKSNASRTQKDTKFRELQIYHADHNPADLKARSVFQGFDAKKEMKDVDSGVARGVIEHTRSGDKVMTTDKIMHHRMAEQPFTTYAKFDVADFVDYGKQKYDKKKLDGGVGKIQ
ncbi:MAG: hypothetical protein WCT04_22990 [Planctomycetota bacterium]